MIIKTLSLITASLLLISCSDPSSTEVHYIDEENGIKVTLSQTSSKVASLILCGSYFNDKQQTAQAEKSLELFQMMSSIGNETWSKTVFVKSVADAAKNQLDTNSIEKIGGWCEANITPMVVKTSEDTAEEYNRRSKYFSFPLRCAQIAMYAFNKPDNKAIADMHIKYVEKNYSWTMDDLTKADTYIKKQFQDKRKRYPAQMKESDLLYMMYANDFNCNEHK